MEMKQFAEIVCDTVRKELGSGCRTEVKEIRKNNGILLHGLVILSGEGNIVPTIYLESYLEACLEGVPIEEVISRILSVYRQDTVKKRRIDMTFFRHLESVKDRICCRLVGKIKNGELLKEIPHVDFLDFAICFYYAYSDGILGEGSILIYNSHMEMWETCTAELFRLARENTPRLLPWKCLTPEDIFPGEDGVAMPFLKEEMVFQDMRTLTNSKAHYGASCILYPDVLETQAASWKDGFYILPSSVHEVILIKASGNESPWELEQIVQEMNRGRLAPEEVLSDRVYFYSLESKRLSPAYERTDETWEIGVTYHSSLKESRKTGP